MQEIPFKIRYLERGLSKTFKKVNFIYSFQVIKNKRGLELATRPSSGYYISSKKITLLVIYYLTKYDGVIKRGFRVIPKITQFMQANA